MNYHVNFCETGQGAAAAARSNVTLKRWMLQHQQGILSRYMRLRFSASVQCKAIRPNQQGEQCQRRSKMDPKGRRLLQRMRQASKESSLVRFVQLVRGIKLCRANLQK